MNHSPGQGQGQGQYGGGAPRRPNNAYGAQQHPSDELHIPQIAQMSPRDFTTAPGPHIGLDQQSPAAPAPSSSSSSSAVPNSLQPGRPPIATNNTAPTLSSMSGAAHHSPSEYSSPSKKPPSLSMSHTYSRASPADPYDTTLAPAPAPSTYTPYTPTTPSGAGMAGQSQYITSPQEGRYNAPGSQRNISNTPLGLADIRPRADSSLSDSQQPGTMGYELANPQPSTSNYLAPWALYAFDWCKWAPQGKGAGKVAIGSYLEDGHNFIQILDTQVVNTPADALTPGSSKTSLEFTKIAEATHSYPVTRLLWEPPSSQKQSTDLVATSGDHLRLWSLPVDTQPSHSNSLHNKSGLGAPITKLTPLALLSNSKTPDHTAPLTSLDWNTVSPSLIITSSIDTTCTIWDIPSLTAKTQLIAHDKEVYDVRFCANSVDVFVSCGQDGSVRMFDLRSLEHSTIIYEPTSKDERDGRMSPTLAQQTMSNAPPLLRIATSPHDQHLLATFAQDSNIIRILDVRQPGQALLELRGHGGSVNSVEWSPGRRALLASGGDDSQVLLWDLINSAPSTGPSSNGSGGTDKHLSPVASWECDYEVGNIGWAPQLHSNEGGGDWLGVSGGRGVWGVKV
ncbi:WD40 repeat-like protein [Astrocystis sublimbata]|nr:WD40 repeat-like protein [Astrocystis sublimbata]